MRKNDWLKFEIRSDEKEAILKLRSEIGKDFSQRGFYRKLIMFGYAKMFESIIDKRTDKEKEELASKLLGGNK